MGASGRSLQYYAGTWTRVCGVAYAAIMKQVSLDEAEKQLKELVAAAAAGDEVVITDAGHPRARLVAAEKPREGSEIRLGTLRGQIEIDPSFYDDMDERDLIEWDDDETSPDIHRNGPSSA